MASGITINQSADGAQDGARSPLARVPARTREYQYNVDAIGWTPEKVQQALVSAESGSMRSLADLVETILSDDRVDGVLATRTLGLLGLPLSFRSGDVRAIDSLISGDWDVLHPESDLVSLMQWGIMLGIGLAQRIPIPRTIGQPQKYSLEIWSPRWLRYEWQTGDWYVQTDQGYESVEGDKWILFTPYGKHRPWIRGKWRSVAFPWLLKRFSLEDRANYTETAGQPIRAGIAPEGANDTQRRSFQTQIASLGRNGAITLPEGWDLKVVEATSTNWQIYTQAVEWADTAITITIAGQIVTTEGAKGFSSGAPQDRILIDFIRFDAKSLAHCLYEQSLVPWARANYGADVAAPWPVWTVERPADLSLQANTFELLSRAIQGLDRALKPSNLRVDVDQLTSTYGIPVAFLPSEDAAASSPDLGLAPTDVAKTITVNEARGGSGLGPLRLPDGSLDPRGEMLISELSASESELLQEGAPVGSVDVDLSDLDVSGEGV